ncbi:voltage-gated potassium channel [Desulforamulus putei DSM 12395]|uniref:Voltage-gated potassium channel n=1 Tax=Desulforamulus putei DSM 12395 TaxID=1121429 RepID=A0A1M4YAD8_9FIRM|nr:potassium channel family protein [Desulforamulus putei]SHF02761.1 voltage-gated potassium channel [Desulforamulus putei DSM 12395]
MDLLEMLHSFTVLFVLLGTLLLLIHSISPVAPSQKRQPVVAVSFFGLAGHAARLIKYSLGSIARMPLLLLIFLVIYGLLLSFYYWYQRIQVGLIGILGLSIMTTMISLGFVALLMSPIIFISQKLLFDCEIESRIFRVAVYSVLVPFLYIYVINDVPAPGPLVEGIMLTGLILNFYQIFKGIFFCLQAPGAMFAYLDRRFIPVLMIISWLLVIIFNLYTMILLVSRTDPYSFIDGSGPVTEPLRLLYFTVITFTSVGYGDITPRGSFAEFITIIVSITGFLYSALFIGGILAVFTGRRKE